MSGNQGSNSFYSTEFCANLRDNLAFCTIPFHLSVVRINTHKIVRYSYTTQGMKCKSVEKVLSTGRKNKK